MITLKEVDMFPTKRRHDVTALVTVRNAAYFILALCLFLVGFFCLKNRLTGNGKSLIQVDYDFTTKDEALKVLTDKKRFERITHPIIFSLPEECSSSPITKRLMKDFHKSFPNTISIILVPDSDHSMMQDYQLTLSSILQTTYQFADRLEIVLLTNQLTDTPYHAHLFDQLLKSTTFNFKIVDKLDKSTVRRTTLFHEMVEVSTSALGDYLIFLLSGVECNVGWLEHLLWPLVRRSRNDDGDEAAAAFITTPHFDTLRLVNGSLIFERQPQFIQLHSSIDLKTQWLQEFLQIDPENYPNEKISPMLLPDVFAVNRLSPLWRNFVKHLNDERIRDATTFDLAQFSWRCLNSDDENPPLAIVTSYCSRIASPSVYRRLEFDPHINLAIKNRLVFTWLNEYQTSSFQKIGLPVVMSEVVNERSPINKCRSFDDYLEITGGRGELLQLGRFQVGRLHSLSKTCFEGTPDSRYLLSTKCDAPFSKLNFFLYQENGLIGLLDGRCLSLPKPTGYVELVKCDSTATQQQWTRTPQGTIKSLAYKDRCLRQTIDPNLLQTAKQILMTTSCSAVTPTDWWSLFSFSDV